MRKLLYTFILTLSLCSYTWAAAVRYATESQLSGGKWVKVQVDKTGFYKLTYAELEGMGFPDPSKVSVHGYGGWPLEEDFNKPFTDDLPATAVWRGTDYLLFYGRGPVKWEYDASSQAFVHTPNPYSLYGYYFLTDATDMREMSRQPQAGGASVRIATFDDYCLHEQELVSVNQSGRELFGEDFSAARPQTISTFSSLPGITDEDGKATMRFIAKVNSGQGTATLAINNSELLTIPIPANTSVYTKAVAGSRTVAWKGVKNEKNTVMVSYNSSGHKNVRLDYIRLQFVRILKPYGACTFFRSVASIGNASRFVIEGANANTQVFDVTDAQDVRWMETELKDTELSFSIPAGPLREFAVIQTDGVFPSPWMVGEVPAQNLHGMEQKDMIIIASPALFVQAERLAEAHRLKDGLSIEVVSPEKIYNEFSSGTPDATAYRRFMKMFYDRSASKGTPPQYLLLFGDGLYDNRGISGDVQNRSRDNLLLTFQSKESLDEHSYVTDDYFAFLEDNSGISHPTDKMCLGVGRFPVRNVEEGKQVVDKVIAYMENKNRGRWKNNLTFVADDGSNLDGYTTKHMAQADQLAESIEESNPGFLTNKVYLDAYKRDNSGGYPDVRRKIDKLLKEGQALINYTGHGSTIAWTDEYVWSQADILQSSYTNLPVWVTATCDFTRFDDPKTSAGESVFLNPVSGGIALFTTTRVVYSESNFELNKALFSHLFGDGKMARRTLGEAMMYTKRDLTDANKLNFILIGDPALRLSFPTYRAGVTAVNGQPVSGEDISFKALDKVTVEGEIWDEEGRLVTDFNGLLYPTVLDSRDSITTLGNNSDRFKFADYPNVLFAGCDSVINGKFHFSFVVPKDISYSHKKGKLNFYAAEEQTGREAQGAFTSFVVGGTSDAAIVDTIGPEIRAIYLNDSTFVSGGRVNTTPYFVARLWDQNGVNITGSSIGHDMMLVIDDMPSRSYTLNHYYTMVAGDEGEGIVQFPLPALEPGEHMAEFKVWDLSNNSTTHAFTFEVVEGLKPDLIEIRATPNPARGQVKFYLYHNRPESELEVKVMVYDLSGKFLWSTEKTGSSGLFKAYVVTWDLTDQSGRRLRPGVYLYRAAIRSDHSREATKANKLIILSQ